MQVTARAKVNWTLDILGVRPDGYHLMDMLMQPITLADTLLLEPADGISLTVEGNPEISALEDNLVWRAATALQKACGCGRGVSIHLTKRTPSGAGLGGGSADAAGTLKGLNTLWPPARPGYPPARRSPGCPQRSGRSRPPAPAAAYLQG